jgi:hypothetical protein
MSLSIRKLYRQLASRRRSSVRTPSRRPQLSVESLEERAVPAAFLSINGAQTLVAGANVNTSNNFFTGESEMQITINPANPLFVAGFTHNVNNLNEMSVYHSSDGGLAWARTVIDGSLDGLGSGVRFDPTIKYDAFGRLFIAYGFASDGTTRLMAARSDDNGASFFNSRVLDSNDDNHDVPGVDKWFMATGLDPSTGGQAVYVAYTHNASELLGIRLDQQISVVGTQDGGDSWTSRQVINDGSGGIFGLDADNTLFAGPAVGPFGELFVVWHDLDDGVIRLDRDLDGLFASDHGFGDDVTVNSLRESFLEQTVPAMPRRGISNGPSIDVDRDPFSAHFGRVYVTFCDTFSGDDKDIYLVTSDDNGGSWHLDNSIFGAGNVEGSSGTDFMPSIAVDPLSGVVNVAYYTTAGDQFSGNDDVNVRLATSFDGGDTFSRVNLSSARSNAGVAFNGNEFGDYLGIAAFGGTARAYWADNRGPSGDLEAFTAAATFSSSTGNNILFVEGDDFGPTNDFIDVFRPSANPGLVFAQVGGQLQYAGPVGSVNAIDVFGFSGDDFIRIDETIAGTSTTVFAGDGNDTVWVGFTSGNLNNVAGAVTVFGDNDTDTVTLWDDLAAFNDTYTVTNSTVSRLLFGGLTYGSVEGLTLNAESGNNTINVTSTSVPTTLNAGGGNDTINVGTGNLGSILGGVIANGGLGTDTVTINDSTSPYAGPYTITNTLVNAPGSFVNGVAYGTIERLNFNAAAGDNTITVASVVPSVYYTLNGGGGNDTLVGQGTANGWHVASQNGGYVGSVAFASMENLTGGAGDDAFILSNGKGVSGRINGGGGVRNWINDTAYTTPVTVNLTTGVATGVGGGISGIQNVFGGAANDTITGDAGNSTLIGGAGDDTVSGLAGSDVLLGGLGNDSLLGGDGRDLLVGGSGADVLDGGNGDDILIGGLLSYYSEATNTLSANLFAAIMGEWTSTFDYATRIKHLTGELGGGRNSTARINSTTVSNDGGAVDTLFGRAGLDWFVVNAGDLVRDLNTGGTETKTTI